MAVNIQRSGQNGIVSVTLPITDLLAKFQAGEITKADAEKELTRRAAVELNRSATVMLYTDEEIDAKVADEIEKAEDAKASRPTGGV